MQNHEMAGIGTDYQLEDMYETRIEISRWKLISIRQRNNNNLMWLWAPASTLSLTHSSSYIYENVMQKKNAQKNHKQTEP